MGYPTWVSLSPACGAAGFGAEEIRGRLGDGASEVPVAVAEGTGDTAGAEDACEESGTWAE